MYHEILGQTNLKAKVEKYALHNLINDTYMQILHVQVEVWYCAWCSTQLQRRTNNEVTINVFMISVMKNHLTPLSLSCIVCGECQLGSFYLSSQQKLLYGKNDPRINVRNSMHIS